MRRLPTIRIIRAAALIGFAVIPPSSGFGQGLPPAPGAVPAIHRDADGHLTALPPLPIAAPPATLDVKPAAADEGHAAAIARVAKSPAGGTRPSLRVSASPVDSPSPARTVAAVRTPCPVDAVTCVSLSQPSRSGTTPPFTFGMPFKQGAVPSGTTLWARDKPGGRLDVQLDQPSRYRDGSLRFAILTVDLPDLRPDENRSVALYAGAPSAAVPVTGAEGGGALEVAVSAYAAQIIVVVFGDRQGHAPGIPFLNGETIHLAVGGDGGESFHLTIDGTTAGGELDNYQKLAYAFVPLINQQSKIYRAYKIGEGGGYESLWITTVDPHAPAFPVAVSYAGRAKITTHLVQRAAPPVAFTATFTAAHAAQRKPTWLNGALAREDDLTAPLLPDAGGEPHRQLAVRVHWRTYRRSGLSRFDVILENDWAYQDGPSNLSYDLAVRYQGKPVAAFPGVNHTHHARWHTVIWSDGGGDPHVHYDIVDFLRSGAVPHYDESLTIADSVLAADAALLARAATGPMGSALLQPYMPMTGARPDIGPLPRWAVIYLLSGDRRARAILLADADAGAAIPIHYRDRKTDQPVSIEDHPGLTMMYGKPSAQDAFPAVANGDTVWTADSAHHPSLFYVPYLITGDLYYLEEQLFLADWVVGSVDPSYRQGARGLIYQNQIRGQAWALRTLGDTVAALPDGYPVKPYFTRLLNQNVAWYAERYAHNANPEQAPRMGFIEKPDGPGFMAPWQQDYLFLAVGRLAEMAVPGADDVMRWLARFSVGRWTSEGLGYCHKRAPAYYIRVRHKTDNRLITTWPELYAENWPGAAPCPEDWETVAYADAAEGYVANASAMLGLASDFGIPGARDAFDRLRREDPALLRAFAADPTFDIVPRQ